MFLRVIKKRRNELEKLREEKTPFKTWRDITASLERESPTKKDQNVAFHLGPSLSGDAELIDAWASPACKSFSTVGHLQPEIEHLVHKDEEAQNLQLR